MDGKSTPVKEDRGLSKMSKRMTFWMAVTFSFFKAGYDSGKQGGYLTDF